MLPHRAREDMRMARSWLDVFVHWSAPEMKSGAVQDDAAIARMMDGSGALLAGATVPCPGCQLEAPVRATLDIPIANHPR
jgi:hypothetical protein